MRDCVLYMEEIKKKCSTVPMMTTSPLLWPIWPCLFRARQVYTPASTFFWTLLTMRTPPGRIFCRRSSGNSRPPAKYTGFKIIAASLQEPVKNGCHTISRDIFLIHLVDTLKSPTKIHGLNWFFCGKKLNYIKLLGC